MGPLGSSKARPGATPAPAKKAGNRRPRQSAAVTITLLPPAEGADKPTMAGVLALASARINLAELGIEHLRPKRAVTGGLILEVPGQESAPRADALAERLRTALADEPVKVSRPVRRMDLRITGLDDAATAASVAAAVAAAGGCGEGEVRAGTITASPRGLLPAVTVSCPERAAIKVAALGRIRVGWVAAKATLLPSRPLQCHRCLAFGHVRVACRGNTDHSGRCYRCGGEGHLAATCAANARCLLCEGAGRAADHRMGGPACAAKKGPKAPKAQVMKGGGEGRKGRCPPPSTKKAEKKKGGEAKKAVVPLPSKKAPAKRPPSNQGAAAVVKLPAKAAAAAKPVPVKRKERAEGEKKGSGRVLPPLPAPTGEGTSAMSTPPPPSPARKKNGLEEAMEIEV